MEIDYSKKLFQMIKDYLNNQIDTETFSNDFTINYNLHVDYDTLSPIELKVFGELSEITSRYSPFEEDLRKYDCYYNENDVKKKAKEVLEVLK